MSISLKAMSQGSQCPPTKPGLLRLYSMRFCPFAQRTRLVLDHKNIPYETVNIDLKSKPDWYLELNPLGQVPALQLDGRVIPESTATCDWLDEVYPEKKLRPEDPYRRAWDRVLLEYLGKVTGAYRKATSDEAAQIEEAVKEMEKHLAWYEQRLVERGEGPFFGGSKPAMIDFLIWPVFERIPSVALMINKPSLDMNQQKHLQLCAWVKAMWQLPAVKCSAFTPPQHAQFRKGYAAGQADWDMFLEE